jgi:hypothetical protein
MPNEIAIYLNLLYFRAYTGRFFGQTSATLLTISVGDVATNNGNNQIESSK